MPVSNPRGRNADYSTPVVESLVRYGMVPIDSPHVCIPQADLPQLKVLRYCERFLRIPTSHLSQEQGAVLTVHFLVQLQLQLQTQLQPQCQVQVSRCLNVRPISKPDTLSPAPGLETERYSPSTSNQHMTQKKGVVVQTFQMYHFPEME